MRKNHPELELEYVLLTAGVSCPNIRISRQNQGRPWYRHHGN